MGTATGPTAYTFRVEGTSNIIRSMSKSAPAHYLFEIEAFTTVKNSVPLAKDPYIQSTEFETSGYKWVMLIYPSGNKNDNGADHISLYLKLIDELDHACFVHATFKFFIYDYKRHTYLTIQGYVHSSAQSFQLLRHYISFLCIYVELKFDNKYSGAEEYVYNAMEKEKGIPKALPLNDFISSSNGFLKNDRCIFGIEVFVTDTIARNARLSNLRRYTNSIYTWPIQEFSKLTYGECSDVFIWEGRPWRLQIYPRGWGQKQDAVLALYLVIQDVSDLINGKRLFVEHELRAKNLLTGEHLTKTIRGWYAKSEVSWGTDELLLLSDLHNSQKGFKIDDKVIVEAKLNQMMLVNDI